MTNDNKQTRFLTPSSGNTKESLGSRKPQKQTSTSTVTKKNTGTEKRGTTTAQSKRDNPPRKSHRKTPSATMIGNPRGYLQG
ncbi:MAG: hypothetical protein ACTSUQ_12965 [Candidatus Freyarchaeota archaeon]